MRRISQLFSICLYSALSGFSCGAKTDQFYWDFLVCKSFLLYHTCQVHLSQSSRRLIPRQFLITNLVIQLMYVIVVCSAAPKQYWHNITWNTLLFLPPKSASRHSLTTSKVSKTHLVIRILPAERQGIWPWHYSYIAWCEPIENVRDWLLSSISRLSIHWKWQHDVVTERSGVLSTQHMWRWASS